jgi:uncharacterized protein
MTPQVERVLSEHQRAVAARVLAEEGGRRRHIVVSLSGAHAYGFPSPDSDLDVKAVHLDPARKLLGFPSLSHAAERLEVIDGVEMDYSSNELGAVLLGVLKGNGNYIERFLSGYTFSEVDDTLVALVRGALSRRVHRHYAGFGTQQRLEWEKTQRTSAKKLLYVLRTTLTGAHLLRTGEVVTDVTQLLERFGFGEALELVQQKTRGEKTVLPDDMIARWQARVPAAFEVLDQARDASVLPEAPTNSDALEDWLVRTRFAELRSA